MQETDALLAEIRLATGEVDEAQLLADIEAALAEVQALSAEEIASWMLWCAQHSFDAKQIQ